MAKMSLRKSGAHRAPLRSLNFAVIARLHGMSALARKTGLQRENLYRALSSKGNPELVTFLTVVRALGLKLRATAA